MRLPRPIIVALACAILLVAAAPAAAQRATVTWNDQPWGTTPITIDQATYPDAAAIPPIVVRIAKVRPNRTVRLEWFNRGTKRWALESSTTSRRGTARLAFNPICTTGTDEERYCNSAFSYRIVVRKAGRERGFISKPLRVSFVPLPA